MIKILRHNLAFLNAILSACSSIPLAIWINLLTGNERPKWLWGNAWLDSIFPLLTIALLAIQYYTFRRFRGLSRTTTEGIRSVLKFGVEILASKAEVDDRQVRGHCYKLENGKLIPIAYFTRGNQKDSNMEIPISDSWFIISRSFTSNDICCDNADWKNPSGLSKEIWQDIKGIIAYPIKPSPNSADPSANSVQPIGVISFNASRSCEQMKWIRRKNLLRQEMEIDPKIHQAMIALAAAACTFIRRDLSNE